MATFESTKLNEDDVIHAHVYQGKLIQDEASYNSGLLCIWSHKYAVTLTQKKILKFYLSYAGCDKMSKK